MKQNYSCPIVGFRSYPRTISTRLIRICWVAVASLCLASPALAGVIIGNFPPGAQEIPGGDIGFGVQAAAKFTMGNASQVLDNVIIRCKSNASGTNIPAIDIRNDAGTTPGTTVLVSIAGTTPLPTPSGGNFPSVQDYTMTATSAFTLAANTSYWIVVRVEQGTFEWWYSAPDGIDPTGPAATFVPPYNATMNDGTSWAAAASFFGKGSFQMNSPSLSSLLNVSTRLQVGTGDDVLIGGFILTGSGNKTLIIRGIGPSLGGIIPGAMADPTLELRDMTGALIGSNDNWRTTQTGGVVTGDQVAAIQASGLAPTNDAEAAIIATLPPSNYTAVLRGANNTTGIAVVEGYDLSQASGKVGDVSTRGFVQTGDGAMIGGFIVGNQATQIVVRAIGPSLGAVGVPTPLADPTLELHDPNGALLDSNDNWKVSSNGGSQQAEIEATGVAPTNDLESALVRTLAPGGYTAVVRGTNNGVGNAVVESYNLQ
jgi:hypothetical protein